MTSAREQRGGTNPKPKCQGAMWWCGKEATHTIVSPDDQVFMCCEDCKDEYENDIFPRMIREAIPKLCTDCGHVLEEMKTIFYHRKQLCFDCHEAFQKTRVDGHTEE